MRTSSKLLGAFAVAGLVAAGGSAFTASNTVVANYAGYGSASVTGATSTAITHTLSGDGTTITTSKVVFDAAQTGRTVRAGFDGTLYDCTLDAADTTDKTVDCAYTTPFTTSTATAFQVSVA